MLSQKDISSFRKVIKEEVHIELKPIKQDIAKIRKDMNEIVGFIDKEYVDLRKRVERIEEHLGLIPLS